MPDRTQREAPELRRQVVSFTFYKLQPEWRRLPAAEKAEHRREFASIISKWRDSEQMTVLTYSLAGLHSGADMMLWRICYSLECLQQMHSELMHTHLGSFLETPQSYLAMTRRSQYKIGRGQDDENTIKCGHYRYASVLPFIKTRNWYQLAFEERQRIVNEYVDVIAEYPRVRMNTLYSFGIDDQEYVLVFETDNPAAVVDLKMRLRETENATYIQQDTPVFTGIQCDTGKMLEQLG
ncbi:MAG TPA: chlorite dismutase family protein [Terriglobales bacterium]|jgi:chlorite dismutase|nr:chlorite dismutase family protein [Terriglobales bacterium]